MVTATYEALQTNISERKKIGEGRYREIFRVGDEALKLMKPYVRKDYGLFHVNFPAELYTKHKFGISDFNRFEYESYMGFIERIPKEFRGMFSRVHSFGRHNNRSFSLSDLVVNSDNEISKPLSEYGQVDNLKFWEKITRLEEMLVSEKVPLLDIRGENIVVREEKGELTPVVIDFKRYGRRTYPMQIWLLSEQKLIGKMRRRFQRLKEMYKPD